MKSILFNRQVRYGLLVCLTVGLSRLGGAWSAEAQDQVPLILKLPSPTFVGTPSESPDSPNVEKPLGHPRPPIMVPAGVVNIALHKTVTSSDASSSASTLAKVTDGEKEAQDDNVVLLRKGPQWVQIDLGSQQDIYAIVIWHAHDTAKVFHGVVAQVADDAQFTKNVRTVFNNDTENKDGLGIGTNREYFETNEGKLIETKGTPARYVRLYSDGNTLSRLNQYTEVEVYGRPAK